MHKFRSPSSGLTNASHMSCYSIHRRSGLIGSFAIWVFDSHVAIEGSSYWGSPKTNRNKQLST